MSSLNRDGQRPVTQRDGADGACQQQAFELQFPTFGQLREVNTDGHHDRHAG